MQIHVLGAQEVHMSSGIPEGQNTADTSPHATLALVLE